MRYSEALEQALKEIREDFPGMTLLENERMSEHTSFKIGGSVRAIAAPSDIFSLSRVCLHLQMNGIAPFFLGNGTNILIPDEGLNIFVISTEKLQKLFLQEDGSIYAEAGVPLGTLSQFAQQNGLSGLEFASGIPGTVGGGILMNAGAYGGEMKDVVRSVVSLYIPDQALYELPAEKCGFGYRRSIFEDGRSLIAAAVFQLEPGDPEEIQAKMKELNKRRREKQPLNLPSAGSAFKRPVNGHASALIDKAGLRGFSVGGAQISEKHAGFVVNNGGATYEDVVELLKEVRRTVQEKFHVVLDPEIRIYPHNMVLLDDAINQSARDIHKAVEGMKSGMGREDS
jgi:UDP-N-acetylmuramate dehydrogenase